MARSGMRLARVALAAAAVSLAACGEKAPPVKKGPPAPVVVRADQGAILKGVAGRGIFDQCTRDRPANVQGFWDPTPQDVKRLEEDLATYLRTHKLPDSSEPVQQSWRQYAGFVRWGHKLIYVNAFPGPLYPGDYWKREAEEVCAGGPAYYGVVYDPQTRAFSEMKFNPATKDWSKKR